MKLKELPLSTEGTLAYEPTTREGHGGNPGWLILRCDNEIVNYYRWWIEQNQGFKVQRPLFGSHISVIRGEALQKNHAQWKHDESTLHTISYNNAIASEDGFWWLPVESPTLQKIREFYGLSPLPEHGFHITIGRS